MQPAAEATVLVCEDDRLTRDLLCENLTADRFEALAAPDAETALRLARSHRPDLLLLDFGLPDASGLDLLRTIRDVDGPDTRLDSSLPVILFSGCSSQLDRLRCLESGADDFLLKPVPYTELLARMRNLLKRCRRKPGERLHVGELVIDRTTRQVLLAGREVYLNRKEFMILCVLAEDPYRIFTKPELLSRVWGHASSAHSRTLESHISRLRGKLEAKERGLIVNAWGVGYRLIEQ